MRAAMDVMFEEALRTIGDPKQGLPAAAFDFIRRVTPLVNVDLLIRRDGESLLAWREDEYGTGWHVMGGIVRFREPLKARLDAVAMEEIGVGVDSEDSACAMNEVCRHERAHFISLLYRCHLKAPLDPARMYRGEGRPNVGALAWMHGVGSDRYPGQAFYDAWLLGTQT